MPIDPTITLSTAYEISKDVQQADGGFSTIDALGSFVNNAKFRKGYDDFSQGKVTQQSYLWEALSAVSQNLGQTLFLNVKNYIDNVSNVDTCKVQALKSMMNMLGINYDVLNKIGYYPIEIQDLINLLSISKKYLLSNKYIKQDFLDAISHYDDATKKQYAQKILPEQMLYDLSNQMLSESFLSIGAASSSIDYYLLSSEQAFDDYLSSIYGNFIYDMLTMRGCGLCSNVELYKTGFLSSIYGPNAQYVDRYLQQKKLNNVNISFNVEQIVDDIESGVDKLENYSGTKLSLLNDEIKYRQSPEKNLSALDLTTRNTYYRKNKVFEYAQFVDNMSISPSSFLAYVKYPYDNSYFMTLSNAQVNMCISDVYTDNPSIVVKDVERAAVTLAIMTKYIAKIREKIRLQTRKIFMKGTSNLLQYATNEFLIDYIDTIKNVMPFDKISAFIEKLSAHSIHDIIVQEYWDQTEYMNLSTSTTKYSANQSTINERFFDKVFSRVNGQLVPIENNVFTNEELNNFYLNELNLANTLYPALSGSLATNLSSNLYEFLSVMFDIAANNSYYDKNGKFGTKLSNSIITEEIDVDLDTVKKISSYINDVAQSADFSFDSSLSISTQLNDFTLAARNAIYAIKIEGISSLYDEYSPVANSISGEIDILDNDLDTLLTATYASYFCKSDSIYSYDIDGNYMFDYFIGNSQHPIIDKTYAMSSTAAREWINDNNCYTFALSNTIYNLSSTYDNCQEQIHKIVNDIEKLDFIDPNTVDLDNEMDSIQTFINSKITIRNTYLQNTLQDLRDQAAAAKREYDTINSSFSSLLASLPALPHQNYYFTYNLNGNYKMIAADADAAENDVYDMISQSRYRQVEKKGNFSKISTTSYIDEQYKISDSDTLEKSITTAISIVELMSKAAYGVNTWGSTTKSTGTQKISLQSLQSSMQKLTSVTLAGIIKQIKNLFNVQNFNDNAYNEKTSCIDKITYLIAYLNNDVSEQSFAGDAIIKSYYVILQQLNAISCNEYITAKSSYEALWTEFENFFTDFAKDGNYRSYIPDNIYRIDEYRRKKDSIALSQINELLDEYDSQYDALQKQFIDMCNNNKIMLYSDDMTQHIYMYNGAALEYCLADFIDALITDINIKDQIASDEINVLIEDIRQYALDIQTLYRKYFPTELLPYSNATEYSQKFNAMSGITFTDIMYQLYDKLEYANQDEYKLSYMLFQNYSGLSSVAFDPYYNIKNQTHPSYQIHPFMWNLVEYYDDTSPLNQIANTIIQLDYDTLEANAVAQSIDNLVHTFGNIVNIWKSNVHDFTGYTTRYESSNHMCKYTGVWSEVVDYDGAFYPPAIDLYLSSSHTFNDVSTYYSHLNIENDIHIKELVCNALSNENIVQQINNIVSVHNKSDVYDIYNYCIDTYGNAYILYKKYDVENPSEFQKRMTPGKLWIRLSDSPIAFPMLDIIDVADSYSQLSVLDKCGIHDICMLGTGDKLIITGYHDESKQHIRSKPLYITYETRNSCGLGTLKFISTNPNVTYIDQTQLIPNIDKIPNSIYAGCISQNTTIANVVYIECDANGKIPDNPNVAIYTVTTEFVDNVEKIAKLNGLSNIIDECPPISYHYDYNHMYTYIDLMFTTPLDNLNILQSLNTNLSAGQLSAADGYLYSDPLHSTMNSFDLLNNQLILKSICLEDHANITNNFQTNTDIGYTPLYAYDVYENVLDMKNSLNSSHQIVELLGKSKDIENIISRININPNPYLTVDDIVKKYAYGRIYETNDLSSIGIGSYDSSLNIYSNLALYKNMPNQRIGNYVMNYVDGSYQWNIILNNDYSYEKLRQLRLFIYSTVSLGKNMYVMADMKDVIDQSMQLFENEFLSTNYDADNFDITTYQFNDGAFTIAINGTQNGLNQTDAYFSNALPNIETFSFKYSTLGGPMYLKLNFKLKDVNADGYIEKDTIKVALVDMFNLQLYNLYHFIDPGVLIDDLQQAINRLSGIPLSKEDLLKIDFSNYDSLSNIQVSGLQILETNHRLAFKASEEDIYDVSSYNYYVPSLNKKYPLTIAHAFDKFYDTQNSAITDAITLYKPNEIYDIEVADAEILSTLDLIQLEYMDVVDEYRVFEDYFYTNDGIANSSRFSPEDPQFYQYAHFSTYGTKIDEMSINQSACVDVRVDGNDQFSKYINELSVFPMHGENYIVTHTLTRNFQFDQLDDSIKYDIIKNMRKFMKLYFSYSKSNLGITLYVNYQNYVNSPYVKLQDGKPFMTILPQTYLKIAPNESGIISIILQFRQYLNNILIGVHNALIATFKIYNISDDKPKFVIEKLSQI